MAESGSYTPETIARRLAIAQSLLGERKQPVTHWAQGLDELAKGYFGGKMIADAEKAEKGNEAAINDSYLQGLRLRPASSASPMGDVPPANVADATEPRGIRNNNPLNIEAGGFTQSQPGFSGSDGRFAQFDTPEAGIGAANKLLDIYQNKHGLNTVAGVVNRWAPANDGNDVSAYAANVSKQLGIDPNAPIPPEMRPQLIAAMGGHENGRPIGNVAQALMAQKPYQVAGPAVAQGAPADVQAPQNDMRAQIVQMLQSPNVAVQRQGRALAGQLMQKQLEGEKPTDEMREYQLYKQQGGTDNFFNYKAGLKKAGAQNITIDQKPELAFDTKAGQLQAERYNDLAADGQNAKQLVSDINTLTDLGQKIGTGKGAEAKAVYGPYAEALGLKVDGLSDIQAYEAIVNRVAPSLRVKGSGAQSDYELKNFLKALPTLGNTQEGNALAGEVMKGLQENKIRAAEIGSQALNKEITRSQAEKMLRELPDPMTNYREFRKKNPTTTAPSSSSPNIDDLLKKYGK